MINLKGFTLESRIYALKDMFSTELSTAFVDKIKNL